MGLGDKYFMVGNEFVAGCLYVVLRDAYRVLRKKQKTIYHEKAQKTQKNSHRG